MFGSLERRNRRCSAMALKREYRAAERTPFSESSSLILHLTQDYMCRQRATPSRGPSERFREQRNVAGLALPFALLILHLDSDQRSRR